jgi:hypothetical protein
LQPNFWLFYGLFLDIFMGYFFLSQYIAKKIIRLGIFAFSRPITHRWVRLGREFETNLK